MQESKRLARNAGLSVIKQLCAVVFPLITFPYVSRVLGAVNYGKVNFSMSIVSYITMIAGLGITGYAVREGARIRDDHERFNTFVREIFTINLCATAVAYALLAGLLLFWEKLYAYRPVILILSIGVLFGTLGADWINTIYEDYLYITCRYILCQGVAFALLFLLVRHQDDYLLYAVTSVTGGVLAGALNYVHIRRHWRLRLGITTSNLRTHMGPILVMFGNSISSLIYINSDMTLLGALTTDYYVGLYAASSKIYSLVKQLVSAAMIVLVPNIASGIEDEVRTREKLNTVLSAMIVLLGPASMGLLVLRKQIILLLSGAEYLQSASSLLVLAISLIFAVLAGFFINVVMVPYRMEKKILALTTVSAVVNIVLNFILIPEFREVAAAATTLISEVIMCIGSAVCSRKKLDRISFRPILVSLLGAAEVWLAFWLVNRFTQNTLMIITMTIAVSIPVFVLIVLLFYRELAKSVIRGTKAKL